jgi:hypothetical protein
MLRSTVSRAVSLGATPPPGAQTRFLLLSKSFGFVHVGRPLWREDGSVVYNCCWSSPVQSFSGPRPAGLMTIFYCPRFETPQPGGRGHRIYIPQKQGDLVMPPGAVSFSSPHMTSRAAVEVLESASTRESLKTVFLLNNMFSVRTSQETHYFSATETNWLMLFRDTVAVYCDIECWA